MVNGQLKPDTPIEYLKGVGPDKAALLKSELDIKNCEDLLLHFPFRYIDRTHIHKIKDLFNNQNTYIQLAGYIENVKIMGFARSRRMTADFFDDTGRVELIWFKGIDWVLKYIKAGEKYLLFGKAGIFNKKINIAHPEFEALSNNNRLNPPKNLQPIYNTSEKLKKRGLDTKGIEKLQKILLNELADGINEILPISIIQKFRLISRKNAFINIHFPENQNSLEQARRRLKFEELFLIQLKLALQKKGREEKIPGYVFENIGKFFNDFYNKNLPFELTNAQKRVLKEIRTDMKSGKQMNRLLQGDVGSGKTIVSLMSILISLDNGMQGCLMAPTEILAQQHFQTISKFIKGLGINCALLTGSTKQTERKELLRFLKSGDIHILIGTHAVIEDQVIFNKLGLVIVDEQHRFGVAQRARLWAKSEIPPHVLVMTATPIPRTLAMTLYGDLETSVIDELPPGRIPIITKHFYEKSRLKLFGFLKKVIRKGEQVYIVYPLIEESETLDYKNLKEGYDVINREFPRPEYQISILHGKMKSADKAFEMNRFKKGETQIMVSTTVIEVGVDVPNATVMVIENAERFGLSQLHQLRGRVGRGGEQSFCLLMTGDKISNEGKIRMKAMVATSNGFEIAEQDLKLRGPGDIAGTRQSGVIDLKIANFVTDHNILTAARTTAIELIKDDPELQNSDNLNLKKYWENKDNEMFNWSLIS